MKISETEFEVAYQGDAKEYGTDSLGRFMFHPLDVMKGIILNDKEAFQIDYQNGQSFDHGSYEYPSTDLDFWAAEGTHDAMLRIYRVDVDELDDTDYIDEILKGLKEAGCNEIKTVGDIKAVHEYLHDTKNDPSYHDYISEADCECKDEEDNKDDWEIPYEDGTTSLQR